MKIGLIIWKLMWDTILTYNADSSNLTQLALPTRSTTDNRWKILTKQHDKVVDVSNESVQGLGRDIFDDVLLVARGLISDQPLEHILFPAQFTWSAEKTIIE